MPAKAQVTFNVLLTEDDSRMLEEMAAAKGCSKGLVVRQSIRNTYSMDVLRVPTCASGQRCPVPHIHATPTPAPQPQPPQPAAYDPAPGRPPNPDEYIV